MKTLVVTITTIFILFTSCDNGVYEVEKDTEINGLKGEVKKVNTRLYRSDSLVENIVTHYSEQGFISKSKYFEHGSLERTETVKRDNHDRIHSIVNIASSGDTNTRYYSYGANGLEKIIQTTNGVQNVVWKYENDISGRKIRETVEIEDEVKHQMKYEYLGDSITKTIIFNSEGERESMIENLETSKKIESRSETYIEPDITTTARLEILRDSIGNPIKETYIGDNQIIQSFDYWHEYDQKQNWKIQFKSKNGNLIEYIERDIEYYD